MALLAEAIVRVRFKTDGAGRDIEKAIKSDPSIARSGTDAGQLWGKNFATAASRVTPKINVGLAADVPRFIAALDAKLKAASEKLKLKVPVEPTVGGGRGPGSPSAPSAPRAPSAPSSSDPVANALRDQIRRLSVSLGREVALKVPVTAETAELRAKLAAEIAELHRVSRLPVPVEAEGKAKFEAELSALAQLVSHRVKVNLPVTVNDKEVAAKTAAVAKVAEKAGKIDLPVNVNTSGLAATFARISSSALLRVGQGAGLAALGVALGSVAAQGISLAGAIVPAAGAIGLLPGVAFAAAAGLGTLALATSGIGEAFKQASQAAAAGGSSMAGAERQVAAAQRESLAAQRDITRARQEAARSLRDLTVQLSGAHIDEREAIQNVADAQKALNAAIAGQNPDTIARAQLEYDKAQQSLTEVQNRVSDLTADQATAAKKGVEGSDQVQAALDRQRSAADALASAQENLAHQGAGVASAMNKLSAAGRQVVNTLLLLRPAWDDLTRVVQQSVFAGVAGDIRTLAGTYLPILKTGLSGIGEGFNIAFRQTAALLETKGFIADIGTALSNVGAAAKILGTAVAPFLDALRQIGVVGTSFLPGFASTLKQLADQFDAFITNARQTGQLQQFFQGALQTLSQLGTVLFNIGRIVVAVFSAGKGVGDGLLGTIVKLTDQVAAFLSSVQGQDALQKLFEGASQVVGTLLPPLLTVAGAIGTTLVPAIAKLIVAFGPGLQDLANGLAGALTALAPAAEPVGRALSDIAKVVGDLLPLVGSLLAESLIEVATVLSAVVRAAEPFIKIFADALSGALQQLLPVLLKMADSALPTLADGATKIIKAFEPSIPLLIDMARQFATNLIPFIGTFGNIISQQLLPAMLKILPVLADGLLDALKQIAPHIPAIAIAMGQMAIAGARLMVAIVPFLPMFIQFVAQIIELELRSHLIEAFFILLAGGMTMASKGATALSAVVLAVAGGISSFAEGAKNKFEALVSFVSALPGKIGRAASGMWDGIKEAFRAAINFVVRAWNSIHLQLPSITIPFVGTVFGGLDVRVPQLPYAAEGALVPARRGGQPVMLGDGGEDEWALGNAKLAALLNQAATAGAATVASGTLTIRVESPIYLDGKRVALAVREAETKLGRQ